MRKLYHMPLDPASRFARLALAEKGLVAQFIETYPWEDQGALTSVNPAGTVPVLIDEPPTGGELAISPAIAIVEYLEDAYDAPPLMPGTSAGRAEARRLCSWFGEKFEREVIEPLLRERIDKRLMRSGQPDYELVRIGAEAISWHFDYFSWLLDQRSWFAGEQFSLADIAAAAHLSAIDYVDAAPWDKFPTVKDWYAKVKSRPCMRPLLRDRINGLPPPRHYEDPDF